MLSMRFQKQGGKVTQTKIDSVLRKTAMCPFCSGKPNNFVHWYERYGDQSGEILSVVCDECGAYGPQGASLEEAVNLWNRRRMYEVEVYNDIL